MTTFDATSDLAKRCERENEVYKKTGESGGDCFALFNRALKEGDQIAWAAIYKQYKYIVERLIYSYDQKYHLFYETGEDVDYFVNRAFALFWEYASKLAQKEEFAYVGEYVNYLKVCARTAIIEYTRQNKAPNADTLEEYHHPTQPGTEDRNFEDSILEGLSRQKVWQFVKDECKNAKEQVVAEESWQYGFAPREIQERHPQIFKKVSDVSDIKKNILKRLRRKLKKRGKAILQDGQEKEDAL